MKRILITGASGTVGRELLSQLCCTPGEDEITVFDRETRHTRAFYKKMGSRLTVVFGDLSLKEDVCRACTGKDVVIHLAAIIPPLADKDPQLAESVNITGTRNLVRCIEERSPEAFFIYSSSISVYGDRNKNPWIRSGDRLIPADRDEYARTKIEAEKIIISSTLDWTIFRLTAIMGTDNHKPSALMFHMPLETCLEIATPADTGRAFVNAVSKRELLRGRIFNLGGGEECRISYRDFLERSFEIMGLGALDFPENTFAARNFHCGYYADGDELNGLLNFRHDTIDDYFRYLGKSVTPLRKRFTGAFRKLIKNDLRRKSEPLAAVRIGNGKDIKHFFDIENDPDLCG